MEHRSSRLASLTLVSKYYPVANYSYPRSEAASSANGSKTCIDRSSYGSLGSAPGLVDDKSDSEVSADDDDQYHAHASELWDSFWYQRAEKNAPGQQPDMCSRKQYPALVTSSPPRRSSRTFLLEADSPRRSPGWPLPEARTQKSRPRQSTASYSPFPKPIVLPTRVGCPVPSWESSRSRECPRRPSRPDESLLAPCVPPQSPVKAVFPSSLKPQAAAREQRCSLSPASPVLERPSTSMGCSQATDRRQPRPTTPPETRRPRTSHASRPMIRAVSPACAVQPYPSRGSDYFTVRRSDTSFPVSQPLTPTDPEGHGLFQSITWATAGEQAGKNNNNNSNNHRYTKSHPSPHRRTRSRLTPEPIRIPVEPRSVFEDDSDGEETKQRSFFRFHKRSGSDMRRSGGRASTRSAEPDAPSKLRARASTAPSSPVRPSHAERKRSAVDVLSCMIGRRRSKAEDSN